MAGGGKTLKVWDLPVRIFHWLLVLCLIGSWVTGKNGIMDLHEIFGVAALILILFRIIWGFAGGEFARFSTFLRGWTAVAGYLRRIARRELPATGPGHNPVGGWSVVAMLTVIAVQAICGLFSTDDILFEGPLARFVSDDVSRTATIVHHRIFNLTLALIALHILAVIAYWLVFRKNLVWPMITGTAEVAPEQAPARLRPARLPLAALALGLAAAVVVGVVYWL